MLGYNGTGTQPDWSGNANSCTVSGATLSNHAPIGAPFAFNGDPLRWFRNPITEIVRRFELPSLKEILGLA